MEKELAYVEKELEKKKIHLEAAIQRNDSTGAENLKNTISILENIRSMLGGDKTVVNCPSCGSMYSIENPHKCRKDV